MYKLSYPAKKSYVGFKDVVFRPLLILLPGIVRLFVCVELGYTLRG
jgi:hypothetical protein